MTTLYYARWILPIASPPIENGAVAVEGSRIAMTGTRDEVSSQYGQAQVRDFGEAAILPGFVNAHSHLELTAMRGYLEREADDCAARTDDAG
jgi:5-methylthioadenosine/S-adenosylhomocysteine deaminase